MASTWGGADDCEETVVGALSMRRRCLIEFRLFDSVDDRGGGEGVLPANSLCGDAGMGYRFRGALLLLLLLLGIPNRSSSGRGGSTTEGGVLGGPITDNLNAL